jgi:cytochrome oxidase Cu insertion factor (SCO1/SenC/PrrC family)
LPREDAVAYRRLPEVEFETAADGRRKLSTLWARRPLLLALVFATCAGVCRPYVRSLATAVDQVGGAGRSFDVAVLSFDPRDSPASMAEMARALDLDRRPGWIFGVVAPGEAADLAGAIGFWAVPVGLTGQFDHPAMVAAVAGGRTLRTLVGASVSPRRLREVAWELSGRFVPTYPLPGDRVLFRCFRYRPESGRLAPDWGLLLLLAPGAGMVLGTALIFGTARRRQPERAQREIAKAPLW